MKILPHYIFQQVLRGLLTVTLVLTGIAWLTQLLKLFSLVLERGLSLWSFVSLTALLVPQIISIILPTASFVVILFVYNRLVMDKELVVMHSGGASRFQLAKPALFLGVILLVFTFLSSHFLEPLAKKEFKNKQFSFRNDLASLVIQEDAFTELLPHLTLYVEKTSDNILYNLILNDSRNPKKMETAFAKKGELIQTQKGLSIALVEGSLQENKNGKITYADFKNLSVDLGVLEEKQERRIRYTEIVFTDLLSSETPKDLKNEYVGEFHRRNLVSTWPLLSITLALVGIFSGSITGRTYGKNIFFTSVIFVGLQALLLTGANMLRENPWTIIPIYGLHLILLILSLLYFYPIQKSKK